jgi:pyruvate dehydrogenase E2 component (dihydrolipoyllysine-residue acetyltransferase)
VIHPLTMPKWGLSMAEGKLGDWLVPEGMEVKPGVELVAIETEKILSPLEATVAGVLRRIVARKDDLVPVAGLIGVIADGTVTDEEIDSFVADFQARFVPEKTGEAEAGPATTQVQIAGRSFCYLKVGDGEEAALLIHGFGGDLKTWLFNQDALANEFAIYALDLRGHGGSSKQVGSGTLDEFVEDVLGFLDSLGLQKVHLVGHSMGGAIAIQFARAHPDRISSLVLIASAGLGSDIDIEYINGFISAQRRKELMPQIEKLFADRKLVTRQLIEDVLRFKRLDGVESSLRAIASQFFPEGRQARVLRDQMHALAVPARVIWGAEDRILPVSHARDLPENITVEILPGSGHMVQMEAAAKVNRVIAGFWRESGGQPRASRPAV